MEGQARRPTAPALMSQWFLRFYAHHGRRESIDKAWYSTTSEFFLWIALATGSLARIGAALLRLPFPEVKEYRASYVLIGSALLLILIASPLNPFRTYRNKTELIAEYSSAADSRQVWWFRLIALPIAVGGAVVARLVRVGINGFFWAA